MSIGVVLSLVACVLWGVSDFAGGLAARQVSSTGVLFLTQTIGLFCVIGVMVATGHHLSGSLDPAVVWAGGTAGIVDAIGFLALYQAMRRGSMGVVAPISAVGVGIPVVVDLVTGGKLGAGAMIGALLAVGGGVLIARTGPGGGQHRGAIAWAVVAAVAFGTGFVLVAAGSKQDVYTTALLMRVVSVPAVGLVLLLTRTPSWPGAHRRRVVTPPAARTVRVPFSRRTIYLAVILCGVTDAFGTIGWGTGSTSAPLAITSMLGSLYPAVTIVLARFLLAERLCRQARWGAWACLLGAACLASGVA